MLNFLRVSGLLFYFFFDVSIVAICNRPTPELVRFCSPVKYVKFTYLLCNTFSNVDFQ